MVNYNLTSTFANVKFGSYFSDVKKTRNGGRNGGIWSTLLHTLHVNGLIDHIPETGTVEPAYKTAWL